MLITWIFSWNWKNVAFGTFLLLIHFFLIWQTGTSREGYNLSCLVHMGKDQQGNTYYQPHGDIPRKCSWWTLSCRLSKWSGRRDLNPRQPAWEAGTLPLSYARFYSRNNMTGADCQCSLYSSSNTNSCGGVPYALVQNF